MFSSLLRPKRTARQRRPSQSEPDQSYFNRNAPFRTLVDDARSLPHQGRQRPSDDYEEEDAIQSGEDRSDDDEEALEEATPLLPIFSAAHLGMSSEDGGGIVPWLTQLQMLSHYTALHIRFV